MRKALLHPSRPAKEISWIKTLAAFANTNGGRMYIGVDNISHKILALDHQKPIISF